MISLITGSTGFIGSHLVRRLAAAGRRIRTIVRSAAKASSLERSGVEIIFGDLREGVDWQLALAGVDEVFHLAGTTRVRSNREYYAGNHLATSNLVKACAEHCSHLRRFVHISSLAAVGPSPDGRPLHEGAPNRPVSDYGKSKMMSELDVLGASRQIPVTILRPSIVYGPSERDLLEYFRMVKRGIFLLIGHRQQLLNLVHDDDLAEAIVRASESPRAVGEIYFVGSERQYTATEVGESIGEVVGCMPLRFHVPPSCVIAAGFVAGSVGRLARRAVFFNLEKAREAIQTAWTCSVEKARLHFGYRQHVSLAEGFRKTYEWYQTQGWLT